MDIKLFNAILAMDSYNRGYDQAIFLGEYDQNGQPIDGSDIENVYIGNAGIYADFSVLKDENGQRLDVPDSFYAIAYQMPNDTTWGGKTIISYRGTDNISQDPLTGWTYREAIK